MWIDTAYALGGGAGGGGPGGGGFGQMIVVFGMIFAIMYFLMIRPQQKKMKTHTQMIGNLRRGDKIVTGGGVFGTVTKVLNEAEVMVEIAEGVRIKISRGTISTLLTQRDPATGQAAPAGAPANDGGGGLLGKLMGRK